MNLNKVFLAGNLTRDPEMRYTPAGLAIATFGLAINRGWTSKDGEKKDEVCYVDVDAFGRTAEVIAEHLRKGSPIFIEGRLVFNQWDDKSGQKRSMLKVAVDSFQFVGGNNAKSDRQNTSKVGVDKESVPF